MLALVVPVNEGAWAGGQEILGEAVGIEPDALTGPEFLKLAHELDVGVVHVKHEVAVEELERDPHVVEVGGFRLQVGACGARRAHVRRAATLACPGVDAIAHLRQVVADVVAHRADVRHICGAKEGIQPRRHEALRDAAAQRQELDRLVAQRELRNGGRELRRSGLAVDALGADVGVAQRHLRLEFAEGGVRHQRQCHLGKDGLAFLLALAQGEAVAADGRLGEGVGSILLLLEAPVHADGEAHRFLVVPEVEQARVGGDDIDDGHAEVLDVVGHHVAGKPVLFFGVDVLVVWWREARVVWPWELGVGVADDEAVLVHHHVGGAERVPAGVVCGPRVAAQRLDHRRRHFLELVLFAAALGPDPVRIDDPVGVRDADFAAEANADVVALGAPQEVQDAVVLGPVEVVVARVLGKGEQPPFLEAHVLVEHEAAAVRVEAVRDAVAVGVVEPHQHHPGLRQPLRVGVGNAVAVPVAVGDAVAVEVLGEHQQFARLHQVVVATVAVAVDEVQLPSWARVPGAGAATPDCGVAARVAVREAGKVGARGDTCRPHRRFDARPVHVRAGRQEAVVVGCIPHEVRDVVGDGGTVREGAVRVAGVGADGDGIAVVHEAAGTGMEVVEARRVEARVVVHGSRHELAAHGNGVGELVLEVGHALAPRALGLDVLIVGIHHAAVIGRVVRVHVAVHEVAVLGDVVVLVGLAGHVAEVGAPVGAELRLPLVATGVVRFLSVTPVEVRAKAVHGGGPLVVVAGGEAVRAAGILVPADGDGAHVVRPLPVAGLARVAIGAAAVLFPRRIHGAALVRRHEFAERGTHRHVDAAGRVAASVIGVLPEA